MKASAFEVNPFGESTYILWSRTGGEAFAVDPGMMTRAEEAKVGDFLKEHELSLTHILLTHCHVDHVAGVKWLVAQTGAKVMAHPLEKGVYDLLPMQTRRFGLFGLELDFDVEFTLEEGCTLTLDGEVLKVLHTPGHSPGSVSLFAPDSALLISGDTLFLGSVGRTDFIGGDMLTELASIKNKLLTLDADTLVVPGHGPTTTIAKEAQSNPYLQQWG